MNASRAESILQSQSGLCRRFFKVVPIQTAWTWQEIAKELARVEGGSEPTRSITLGCLTTLASAGLVREKPLGSFQSLVKPNNPVIKEPVMAQTPAVQVAAHKPTLLERLGAKADQLRDMADELDTLAVEISDTLANGGKAATELAELQSTLGRLLGQVKQ